MLRCTRQFALPWCGLSRRASSTLDAALAEGVRGQSAVENAPLSISSAGLGLAKHGVVHVRMCKRNTICALTKANGDTIAKVSAGTMGYKGPQKTTMFANQAIGKRLGELCQEHKVTHVEVRFKGIGPGRKVVLFQLQPLPTDSFALLTNSYLLVQHCQLAAAALS
ncbi:unnamed protein product [Chrysoparadoxa australica]